MTGFWMGDRNRSDADERMPERVAVLASNIGDARESLVDHRVYQAVTTEAHLHLFMEHHVFAVWDFMCLLKALQRNLSCVDMPWVPVGDPNLRRLVNDIVLAEETDEGADGGYTSHFELYVNAMRQCGADVGPIDALIDLLRKGVPVRTALRQARPPAAALAFSDSTFDIIESGSIAAIAGAFTFSREDVVPVMFKGIVDELRFSRLGHYDTFIYYLDRHIAVDGDQHGPMAFEMVNRLCEDDPDKWTAAEAAARSALENRAKLWDGALAAIRSADATRWLAPA